tara:strand:+ start:317 stop:430 length:114 start_codon:yes stop_codon:yes gene_type:complete
MVLLVIKDLLVILQQYQDLLVLLVLLVIKDLLDLLQL